MGRKDFPSSGFRTGERLIYRLAGVGDADMSWKEYALAFCSSMCSASWWYTPCSACRSAPFESMKFGPVTPDQAFNTAVSFATNTNWQSYGGETTMSYLTQMLGLTVQNFLSAATGMAAVIAFIRGFARATAKGIGNAWVDLVRSTLYIFLPLAFITACLLVSQGVVQNFRPYQTVNLLQPTSYEKPKLDAASRPQAGRARR
jgi:K+-transporting ATPase ATPase A chain